MGSDSNGINSTNYNVGAQLGQIKLL
jgi:hypothetical protein